MSENTQQVQAVVFDYTVLQEFSEKHGVDYNALCAAVIRAAAAPQTAAHPDDVAVDALAALMKAKLAKQREKGYGGWDTDCTQQRLSDMLRGHVDKGDPVDVANFCAFLLARGEGIAAAPQAVQPAVPDDYALRLKIERGLMERSLDEWVEQTGAVTLNSSWHSELASIVQMAFDKGAEVRSAHPAEGVPAQSYVVDFFKAKGFYPSLAQAFAAGVAHAAATQPAAQGSMTVIDQGQWEPCSPSYLQRGGCCASAPRVWDEATNNHWHPKLPAQPAAQGLKPCKPIQPEGMTSINARLSFNFGWLACERHHGIRPADVAEALALVAAQAKKGGA